MQTAHTQHMLCLLLQDICSCHRPAEGGLMGMGMRNRRQHACCSMLQTVHDRLRGGRNLGGYPQLLVQQPCNMQNHTCAAHGSVSRTTVLTALPRCCCPCTTRTPHSYTLQCLSCYRETLYRTPWLNYDVLQSSLSRLNMLEAQRARAVHANARADRRPPDRRVMCARCMWSRYARHCSCSA